MVIISEIQISDTADLFVILQRALKGTMTKP